jgi:hypothetical protein
MEGLLEKAARTRREPRWGGAPSEIAAEFYVGKGIGDG